MKNTLTNMKNNLFLCIAAVVVGSASMMYPTTNLNACSTIKLQKGNELIYGHNLNEGDIGVPGMVFVNKRGVFKNGRTFSELINKDGKNPSGYSWISRYGSVSLNACKLDAVCAGQLPDAGRGDPQCVGISDRRMDLALLHKRCVGRLRLTGVYWREGEGEPRERDACCGAFQHTIRPRNGNPAILHVYFKTRLNPAIKSFSMDSLDFPNNRPTLILDIDTPKGCDVMDRLECGKPSLRLPTTIWNLKSACWMCMQQSATINSLPTSS